MVQDKVRGGVRSHITKLLNFSIVVSLSNSSLVVAVLCVVGFLAVSLASSQGMPVAPSPPSCDDQKGL